MPRRPQQPEQPAQPSPQTPTTPPPALTPWDHLVLVGYQVKTNLARAMQRWEADFRDQIKQHLLTLPEGHQTISAANVIKVMIVTKGATPAVDSALVDDTFVSALQNGSIQADELRTLFESGALGVRDYQAVITLLNLRGHAGTYMTTPNPENFTKELRWQILSPAAENGCGVLADLPDRVHVASSASLSPEDVRTMLPTTEQRVVDATRPPARRRPR